MDLLNFRSRFRIPPWASRRILAVPKNIKRRLTSGFLLALALLLGFWANHWSELEAIREWEKKHVPDSTVFKALVQTFKLKEMQDNRTLQKINRLLPVHLEEAGSIWKTENSNWIVFYSDPNDALQMQVYCQECSIPPQTPWKRVGVGWIGVEALLEELKKGGFKKAVLKKRYRDPREIVY